MSDVPWDFSAEDLTINDIFMRKHRKKIFNSPTYLGKLNIPKPEKSLSGESFNMYEGCGSFCYVFGFALWNTLIPLYDMPNNEPSKIFRNIGCSNEFILVGENGTFVFTRNTFNSNGSFGCSCGKPQNRLFRFIDYNSEEMSWNFKNIHYRQPIALDEPSDRYFCPLSLLDHSGPCPEEIWDKFPFLAKYRDKKSLGPEIPVPAKTKEIVQAFTKTNSIVYAKKLENYHFAKFYSDLRIIEVDATLFVSNNEQDSKQYSTVYINNFPKFDVESDQKWKRKPEMWLYDPSLTGFCCDSREHFFRIAFENNLKQLDGIVIDIRNQNIHIFITDMNLEKVIEIPLVESHFSEQIKEAYDSSKTIKVEVLSFFNAIETKYKIAKFQIS